MSLEELLNLNIQNLTDAKYEALKKHTINKLNNVINLLEKDELQKIAFLLSYSDAGDGWGNENYFINFGYNDTDILDLGEILIQMASLKNIEIDLDMEEK